MCNTSTTTVPWETWKYRVNATGYISHDRTVHYLIHNTLFGIWRDWVYLVESNTHRTQESHFVTNVPLRGNIRLQPRQYQRINPTLWHVCIFCHQRWKKKFTFDLINIFGHPLACHGNELSFIIQSYTCTVSISCVMVSAIVSNCADGASLTHPIYTIIIHWQHGKHILL